MKNYQNKFDFRQQTDGLDIYIYSVIQPDYKEFWTGEEVKSETSARHFKELLEQFPNVSTIRLFINSEGGSVKEAMGIRSLLARHDARKIAFIDGWAASAASFIVTVCDEVMMFSSSMQMLHNMWVMAAGNAKDLRQMADALDKMMEGNRQAYLEKAGEKLSEEKLIELMEAESWLTAKDCIDYGLADEIISGKTAEIQQLSQLIQSQVDRTHSEPEQVVEEQQIEVEPVEAGEVAPEQSQGEDGVTKGQNIISFMRAILKEN